MATRNIYITDTTDPLEDGSIDHPYDTFSDINWTTGGDNSIFDWVAADDDVYINLKRGCVWREQLTIGTSGASGHPITIQAYGTGADPIIIGADDVTGVSGDWTEQGDGVWRKDIGAVEPKVVIFNSATWGTNDATPDTEYEWTYSDPNLDIYTEAGDNNPVDYYTSVEAGQRHYGVNCTSAKDYITIDGIEFRHQNTAGIRTGLPASPSGDTWIVKNCTCHQIGDLITETGNGIMVYTINSTIQRNVAYDIGSHGIYVVAQSGSPCTGNVIEYNTVYDIGYNNIDVKIVDTGTLGSLIVRYNQSYATDSFTRADVSGIYVKGAAGNVIDGVDIYHNLFWRNTNSNIMIVTNTTNINVYNNIMGSTYATGTGSNLYINNGTGTLVAKNNIGMDADYYSLRVVDMTNKDIDYNCWYNATTAIARIVATNYTVWATYQAAVAPDDANSIASDPLFVDAASGNFKLNATSPCRDAGVDVSLTSDYAGRTVPKNHTPDIGAYELFARGVHKKFYNRLGLLL